MSHKYDQTDPTSWKDILLPKDADTQRLLVAALKLVQAAKETTRLPDGSLPPIFPAGDLVFELAKLHTSTMGRLADIASKQATKMLEHTQETRTGRRGYGGHTMQVLVAPMMTEAQLPSPSLAAEADVPLRNKSSSERTFAVPEIIELVRVENGKCCEDGIEYGQIFFRTKGSATNLEEIKVCPKSATAAGTTTVVLSMPFNTRLATGRYRGHVILESTTGGPHAEIIVELTVKRLDPPAPPVAAPPAGGSPGAGAPAA